MISDQEFRRMWRKHSPRPRAARPKLPANYKAALRALRACAKEFTPLNYVLAAMAMDACEAIDECSTWPATVETMRTYDYIAGSSEMTRLIRQVEAKRKAWCAGA